MSQNDRPFDADYNLGQLCRLCIGEETAMLSLFDENENLPAKIKDVSSVVEIRRGDGMPSLVCEECVTQLNSFSEFKLMIEASNNKLKDLLSRESDRNSDLIDIKEETVDEPDELIVIETETDTNSVVIDDEIQGNQVNGNSFVKQEPLDLSRHTSNSCEDIDNDHLIVHDDNNGVSDDNADTNNDNLYGENIIDLCHSEEEGRGENVAAENKPVFSTSLTTHLPYQCVYECSCSRKFTNFEQLKIHGRSHAGKHDCMICHRKFRTWQQLICHRRTHVDGLGHECPHCHRRYSSEKILKIHRAKYHPEGGSYKCTVCNETFDTEHSMRVHIRHHAEEREHVCHVCSETFSTGLGLREHSRKHTLEVDVVSLSAAEESSMSRADNRLPAPKHECDYCKKKFNFLKGLRGHERYCKSRLSTETSSASNVSKQVPLVTERGFHKCPCCEQIFSDWTKLSNHIGGHKRTSQRCTFCKKDFNSFEDLANHLKIHKIVSEKSSTSCVNNLKASKFECVYCKKKFSFLKGLRGHERHCKSRPPTETSTASNVSEQVPAVTERLHKCSFCELTFSDWTKLSNHMTEHKRTSQTCTFCKKSFNSLEGLTNHLKIHRVVSVSSHSGMEQRFSDTNSITEMSVKETDPDSSRPSSVMTTSKIQKPGNSLHNERKNNFKCSICKNAFRSVKALYAHGRVHKHQKHRSRVIEKHVSSQKTHKDNVRRPYCEICQKEYKNFHCLSSHTWAQHRKNRTRTFSTSLEVSNEQSTFETQKKMVENLVQKQKYYCIYCNMSLESKKSFLIHNDKFHKDKPKNSTKDKMARNTPQSVHSNIEIQNKTDSEVSSRCKSCDKVFSTRTGMLIHVKKAHKYIQDNNMRSIANNISDTEVMYECEICNKKFSTLTGMRIHRHKCHIGFPEDSSENHATDNTGLLMHQRETRAENCHPSQSSHFQCVVCDEKFNEVKSFRYHCTRHQHMVQGNIDQQSEGNSDSIYECPTCSRSFFNTYSYFRHTLKHQKDNSQQFENAEFVAISKTKQTRTVSEVNSVTSEDTFSCALCERSYSSSKSLKAHCTSRHNGVYAVQEFCSDNQIQCTYKCCGKLFYSEKNLKIHRTKFHETENDKSEYADDIHTCTLCERVFSTSKGLSLHRTKYHSELNTEKVQDDEDEYNCSACDRSFPTSRGRSLHYNKRHSEQIHETTVENDEDEFACSACDRSFPTSRGRSLHYNKRHSEQIHGTTVENGENEFACSACERSFSTRRGLTYHYNKIHSEMHSEEDAEEINEATVEDNEYSCFACDRSFSTIKGRTLHYTKNHLDVLSEETNTKINDNENQSYECSICDKSFLSEKGQRLHYRKVHEEVQHNYGESSINYGESNNRTSDQFLCSLCDIIFDQQKGLKIHNSRCHKNEFLLSTSNGIKTEESSSIVCTVCSMSFDSIEALMLHNSKNHTATHENSVFIPNAGNYSANQMNIYVECNHCGKTFSTDTGLKIHMKKQHPI